MYILYQYILSNMLKWKAAAQLHTHTHTHMCVCVWLCILAYVPVDLAKASTIQIAPSVSMTE